MATKISAAFLLLFGVALLSGGVLLASLGGSPYYAITGAVLMVSAVLYWRGAVWGERFYALMLAGTLIWACFEAGSNPWALSARVVAPAVFGLWLALPWVRKGLAGAAPWRSEAAIVSVVIFAVVAVRFVQFEHAAAVDAPPSPVADQSPAPADTDWASFGNGLYAQRFAPLAQINTQNVDKLQVAWVHHSGDVGKTTEATPLKIGDTLYTCTPHTAVIAIDAKTGQERWRNDIKGDTSHFDFATCRGVSYYHVPDGAGVCTDRIIAGGPGGILRALDAATGAPCADFGNDGVVNLLVDLGSIRPNEYTENSTPTVAGGMIIVGAYIADSYDMDIASGVIRAFDAKTGALRWAWDMGAPERIGAPPTGETYTRGTPNSWPAFAADEALGLVYVPLGNPSPDFYGTKRRPFDEKYGSALVALNLTDGRERWSYQTTHHDLWDYDLPAQPTLIDLPGPDGNRPAILQATKRGDIFVLDRRDGTPIVPAPERPVPGGAMPGEALSKTQPVSDINFIAPPLTEAQMWGATPIDQMLCRIDFRRTRYEGPFTPPGLDYTFQYPGPAGGVDWAGISVDDDNKVVVANTVDMPIRLHLVPRETVPNADNGPWPQMKTPYVLRLSLFMGRLFMPCLQPPWGQLAAVDLKTAKVIWRQVVGRGQDNGPLNIPSHLPLLIGTPNSGGTLTTRGGLIFMGATTDRTFRAFDSKTGRILWEYQLPIGAHANPMTYMAGGKQYVVVTASGHNLLGTKMGDATIAFTLPDTQGK